MARPSAIVPVSKIDDGFIRICVYGDPGVGKTPLAGTSPRCLIVNADPHGTVSAAVAGSKADRWDVTTGDKPWEEMEQVSEYFRHGGCNDYSWVWLDSLTLFQGFGVDQIMNELVIAKPHRHTWQRDQGDIGQNMTRIQMWVRVMSALPINFGITCHIMQEEDPSGRTVMKPSVQGKNMSDTICGYMAMVAYMYQRTKDGNQERGIQTIKDAKRVAKDRFNAVPGGRMLNPTIPRLEELIKAKLPADTPRPKQRRNPSGRSQRPQSKVRRQAQKRTSSSRRRVT